MEVSVKKDGSSMSVAVVGNIDTVTAPELEARLLANWAGVTSLVLDFARVDYISSAGLRVVMSADQHMSEGGQMTIRNVNPDVKAVFAMTGFDTLLHFA